MRELPSQVKGDRLRAYFRRNSCVRIAPPAPYYYIFYSGLLNLLISFSIIEFMYVERFVNPIISSNFFNVSASTDTDMVIDVMMFDVCIIVIYTYALIMVAL